MWLVEPAPKHYAWGSLSAIPDFREQPRSEVPIAEVWYGAHPAGESFVLNPRGPGDTLTLGQLIRSNPNTVLGRDTVERLGPHLPYLMKVIAPAAPLSLQVHPNAERAALGYAREERMELAKDAPNRVYRDPNHKPEMLYALSDFEALSGFRAPRRAVEVLGGLEQVPLLAGTIERIRTAPSSTGMRSALEYLLLGGKDRVGDVADCADIIRSRLLSGRSPSSHSDRIALQLSEHYGDDRGVLASLLLNPVTLRPGEVMFVPAGCIHAYLSGLGIEVMASSDNVVRAGLTKKHVDSRALLEIIDVLPAPPMRLAAEHISERLDVFYAPVEEFELAVITLDSRDIDIRGFGPRIVMPIDGEAILVDSNGETVRLRQGQTAFLAQNEAVRASGHGRLVRVSVP